MFPDVPVQEGKHPCKVCGEYLHGFCGSVWPEGDNEMQRVCGPNGKCWSECDPEPAPLHDVTPDSVISKGIDESGRREMAEQDNLCRAEQIQCIYNARDKREMREANAERERESLLAAGKEKEIAEVGEAVAGKVEGSTTFVPESQPPAQEEQNHGSQLPDSVGSASKAVAFVAESQAGHDNASPPESLAGNDNASTQDYSHVDEGSDQVRGGVPESHAKGVVNATDAAEKSPVKAHWDLTSMGSFYELMIGPALGTDFIEGVVERGKAPNDTYSVMTDSMFLYPKDVYTENDFESMRREGVVFHGEEGWRQSQRSKGSMHFRDQACMPFVQHSVPWVITTKQISGKLEDVQEGPFQEIARGFFKTTVLDEEKASKSQWGEGYFNILTADKGYQGTFTYNGGVFPGKEPHNRSGTFVPHGRGTLMAYEGNGLVFLFGPLQKDRRGQDRQHHLGIQDAKTQQQQQPTPRA